MPGIMLRMPSDLLAALDAYVARQPEPAPSRPEMIRKLLEDRFVHEGLIEAGAGIGTRT